MGIIERIVLEDTLMQAVEERARRNGTSIDNEAAELVRLGLSIQDDRATVIERARALRASLPRQTMDSLELLLEDRNR